MTARAAWLLPEGQTREDTRLAPVGTYTPAGELTTAPGIIPGGNPFAATGAGAMQVQIGTGRAIVQGTTAQGAYPVAVTAPVTLTVADGNAQWPRIDTIAVHVYDGLYDPSGRTAVEVEIIGGEPAADPTAPALPPGTLPLWDISVPAGASAGTGGIDWSSALDDRRRYTVAAGGIAPGGHPGDEGAYDGQWADQGGVLSRWSAERGAWETYTPPTVRWSQPVPLTAIATLAPGVTMGTPAVQVRDLVIGGVRTREFWGVLNTANVGSGAYTLFTFHAGYRPAYERDYAIAGVPGANAYRLYVAVSGNVGTTGHPAGQNSIPMDQLRIINAPGVL